ncbi:hypothetical protein SAMN05428949_0388 [Chitinophaga sp. YR627]|uniref:hypothetical protein n=1 Tax=Chitinophaga sp. YR627 TaxID=1881041 RepID=UPI0008E8B3EF|nr:hypothetical protein [Chitinophaga sp. YR627]SFM67300.1 hypothetical protein SAMN05428949_0388 [Chitinophaga sp. YR627]
MAKGIRKMIIPVIILLLLGIVVVCSIRNIINGHGWQKDLNKNGRYVVAMIRYYEPESGKYKDRMAQGHFYLTDIEYPLTLQVAKRDAPPVGRVILKVLESHPETYELIYYERVPACFDNEESMRLIWDEIPQCPKP